MSRLIFHAVNRARADSFADLSCSRLELAFGDKAQRCKDDGLLRLRNRHEEGKEGRRPDRNSIRIASSDIDFIVVPRSLGMDSLTSLRAAIRAFSYRSDAGVALRRPI